MALDVLAERIGARFSRHKTNTLLAEARLGPGLPKLVLVKPNSYMNLSGGPVSSAAKFFDLGADRIIVLHDELDIPFDTVKLKVGGGHGGHNGLRDIQAALGTADFARVRIGIGRPPGRQEAADFVLSPFSKTEREALPSLLSDAADAAEDLVREGLFAAQQRWHAPRA
jgi:PTH1 family peptidyl-tRNA hydrolase